LLEVNLLKNLLSQRAMLTFKDLKEKLETCPEIDLLELLEISSTDLVDRFSDRIDEKFDYLVEEFDNEE
jgi:hypothetical protein